MMRQKIVITVLGILMLSACGGSKTVKIPPEPLTTYTPQVLLEESGSVKTGKGDGKMYLQLQPAFIDDRVFTADFKGRVAGFSTPHALKKVWQVRVDDARITGGVGAGSDLVFVGTQKGQLVALSQNEGEELWRIPLSGEVLSAPQSAAGIVVVLTEDSRVHGIDASNGERLWGYRHTAPLLQLRGSAPVIINDGIVYAGFANGQVVALDLTTGELLWQEVVSYPRGRSEIDRIVDVNGRMAVYGGVLYVVNYQGRVIAFDVHNQDLLWEKELSSYAGLAVSRNAVFVTDEDSRIWALDRATGDTLWQQMDLRYRSVTAPTVYKNMIAVGDYEGYVHLLQASNGQLIGREQVDSKPIHTPPITVEDNLFVLSSSGRLTRYVPVPAS